MTDLEELARTLHIRCNLLQEILDLSLTRIGLLEARLAALDTEHADTRRRVLMLAPDDDTQGSILIAPDDDALLPE